MTTYTAYQSIGPLRATQWNKHGDHDRVRPLSAAEVNYPNDSTDERCGALIGKIDITIVHPGDWVIENGASVEVVSDRTFARDYIIQPPDISEADIPY